MYSSLSFPYLHIFIAAAKYTQQTMQRLADLNADASLVGFYTSCNNGQHLAMGGFVEALVGAQLSGGGLGSNTGKAAPVGRAASAASSKTAASSQANKYGKGIALVYGQFHTEVWLCCQDLIAHVARSQFLRSRQRLTGSRRIASIQVE